MLDMYMRIIRIRQFESAVIRLFQKDKIPGFFHTYVGEEAIAVRACAALTEKDYITSTHQEHGHLIAKGARIDGIMAELYGKRK